VSEHDPLNPREAREDADRRKFIERQQQADDVAWLLADARGRRLMYSWLEFCGVFRISMTGNSQTFFNEGQRNVGLMLLGNVMAHSPEAFALMRNEAKAEADAKRRAHSADK
jgi:hypothetical protein